MSLKDQHDPILWFILGTWILFQVRPECWGFGWRIFNGRTFGWLWFTSIKIGTSSGGCESGDRRCEPCVPRILSNIFCGKCHRTRVVWIKFKVLWFPVCCHCNSVVFSMYGYLQDIVWTCMNWIAPFLVLLYAFVLSNILNHHHHPLILHLTILFKVVKLKNSSLFRIPDQFVQVHYPAAPLHRSSAVLLGCFDETCSEHGRCVEGGQNA